MKIRSNSSYNLRNYLHSLILLVAMLALLSLIGWLLMGAVGIGWFLSASIVLFIGAVRISPHLILMMRGARVLSPEDSPYLYGIIFRLSKQAGIKNIPTLYYMPGRLMNIFTTGLNKNASIALSYGIVRELNERELTGVLAHEISHIRSHDLLVMLIAAVIASLTSFMALTGSILILIYFPLFILMGENVPWTLLIVLILAPTVSALMQFALSRSRELSADVEAARLTDDPLGLASALVKIESQQRSWIERIFMYGRHIDIPLLFRTHPLVTDRINRLKALAVQMRLS